MIDIEGIYEPAFKEAELAVEDMIKHGIGMMRVELDGDYLKVSKVDAQAMFNKSVFDLPKESENETKDMQQSS